MARLLESANRLSLQLGRGERHVLRIRAAPSTKAIRQRLELLNDFTFAQTGVSHQLECAWSIPLIAKLHAGEIDMSFMMGAVDPALFERIVLAHYGAAITVARSHEWAARPFVQPEDLRARCVQVFTRNLNPDLWDMLYAPLVKAGCLFIEMPEMAEGAPARMRSAEDIAAFFDFGDDDPGGSDISRIPLRSQVAVPFQLLRSVRQTLGADGGFWEMAQRRAL